MPARGTKERWWPEKGPPVTAAVTWTAVWKQKTTVLPVSLHFTNFKMILALFLFLNGVAAQET